MGNDKSIDMAGETQTMDKVNLTRAQKEKRIFKRIGQLKNKAAYCNDAMKYLNECGFIAMDGYSFYTNYICRKRLPKEEIKLNFLYEFTKEYKVEEEAELERMGGETPSERADMPKPGGDNIKGPR